MATSSRPRTSLTTNAPRLVITTFVALLGGLCRDHLRLWHQRHLASSPTGSVGPSAVSTSLIYPFPGRSPDHALEGVFWEVARGFGLVASCSLGGKG